MAALPNLLDLDPADTYKSLAHFGDAAGIDTTLRTLYDGKGSATPLQLATTGINFNLTALGATWKIDGTAVTVSASQINSVTGKQDADATLTALAALTTAANKGIYATASDTFATYDLTAGGRALGGLTGAADKGAYFTSSSAAATYDLTAGGRALTGLTGAADKLGYFTSSSAAALADFTSAARSLLDDTTVAAMRATLGSTTVGDAVFIAASALAAQTALSLVPGTDVQAYDADLAALAANGTDGFWAHTGAGTGAARTLTAPAAGFTITNPAGIAGNPTFVLADDLAALEALSSTGILARTGTSTYSLRTLTGPAAGISVSNGDGVSGNPTLALANDLAALEALSGTDTIYYRSGADTWTAVTIGGVYLTFSGGTLTALKQVVATLTDGATPALNAALGDVFLLVAAGDRTIGIPTNPVSGQKIIIAHTASGGARTLALNIGAGGFRFGSDITSLTATASGKTDYIGSIYNATDNKWDVVAVTKGF